MSVCLFFALRALFWLAVLGFVWIFGLWFDGVDFGASEKNTRIASEPPKSLRTMNSVRTEADATARTFIPHEQKVRREILRKVAGV